MTGGPIDWSVAVGTATRLVSGGPRVPLATARVAVEELRRDGTEAELNVREVTGLGQGLPLLEPDVVDRIGWVNSAVAGMEELTSGAFAQPTGKFTRAAAGAQLGVVLGYISGRILGQYDPFAHAGGRLLLVAPNIVGIAQGLGVNREDFQLWVCLHESTHRLQFTAVPWLRDYFQTEVRQLIGDFDSDSLLTRLPTAVKELRSEGFNSAALIEALQPPEQADHFRKLLALSTLLEGHADYVMDAVGPEVVPSVAQIRERFNNRRSGGSLADRVMRSVMGMNVKLQQYATGSKFTKHVVGAVGMDGFNRVWQSPDTLPTMAEFVDPEAWLVRVA
jgi:coenzyme F420 biosynthesis associated uncharacterized protein